VMLSCRPAEYKLLNLSFNGFFKIGMISSNMIKILGFSVKLKIYVQISSSTGVTLMIHLMFFQ